MKKMYFSFAILLVLSLAGCGTSPSVIDHLEDPVVSEEQETETSQEEETETEEPVEEVLPEASIKDVFAEHGVKAGLCITTRMTADVIFNEIIKSQFNSCTMENAMKPDAILNKDKSIEAGDIVVEFKGETLTMLEWAKKNNMSMRGHTIIWYSQTPNWIFHEDFDTKKPKVTREVMLARMESYIKQVFQQLSDLGYIDLFYAYDVVNEAWLDNGKMRENNWSKIIGDDYLWYAFYYADKYAPESIDLYYNDYNEQFKYSTIIEFVNTLVDEDGRSLIDGIGLQGHLYTKDDYLKYFMMLDKLGETGLKLEITELDVCLGAYNNFLKADDENLKAQGRYYYTLISNVLKKVDEGKINLDSITFWGLTDNMSWRSTGYPLLFNFKGDPKYAYYGVVQMKDYAGFNN